MHAYSILLTHRQWVFGQWRIFLMFWLFTAGHWIWNETMTSRLNCWLSAWIGSEGVKTFCWTVWVVVACFFFVFFFNGCAVHKFGVEGSLWKGLYFLRGSTSNQLCWNTEPKQHKMCSCLNTYGSHCTYPRSVSALKSIGTSSYWGNEE